MFKIRFNLGRGKNYKKWKITTPNKNYYYYDPNEVNIIMREATLFNAPSISNTIFNGANKRVCAWIECKDIFIKIENGSTDSLKDELRFNPRVSPNWSINDENVDFQKFNILVSKGNKVYNTDIQVIKK